MDTGISVTKGSSDDLSLLRSNGENNSDFLVMRSPHECALLYQQLSKSVASEGLLFLPNSTALLRDAKLGIINNLIQCSRKGGVSIRILCPLDTTNQYIVDNVQKETKLIQIMNSGHFGIPSTFFVLDAEKFIQIELNNPTAQEFESAIGLGVYSNSRPGVDSSKMFFEILWNQAIQTQELKTRGKAKDEFIAVASHELRTPIQPILGYALLARKGKISQDVAWDGVLKEARRLQQLANDILDVTKIDSGNLSFLLKNEKINELISSIVDGLRGELQAGVEMTVVHDETYREIELSVDRSRIAQVLSNLIGNAMKFTNAGTIQVITKVNSEQNVFEIRVTDTGTGIPTEIIPALFEKFVTKGHGDVKNNKGTGLGLYISKAIVEMHGGKIIAFNNNTQPGATFLITLPLSTNATCLHA